MPTISIKSMLDAHVAANGKTWAHDRDLTVGASEVGQCLRKSWFAKNGVDPDPDYIDRYGAKLRGDLIENHHWEPGIRAQLPDGVALLFAGQDQKTLVDGYLSATSDGLLAGVSPDALSHHGADDSGGDSLVVECKSIDPRVSLKDAKAEHEFQVHCQMGLIRHCTEYRPSYALISYTDASFLDDVTEFAIAFDPEIHAAAKTRATRVMTAAASLDLPPEGKLAGGGECRYCPHRSRCAGDTVGAIPEDKEPLGGNALTALKTLVDEEQAARAGKDATARRHAEARERIKEFLREHRTRKAEGDNWSVTWFPVKGRLSLDRKAVEATGGARNIIKFRKGRYFYSQDDIEIPAGTRLIANMAGAKVGWVRWWDGRPTDEVMVLIADGVAPPRRSELGDDDRSQWETDDRGDPKDPWQFTNHLPLKGPETGDAFLFATSTRGGIGAIGAFAKAYGTAYRQKPGKLPVVELRASDYAHPNKAYGRVDVPVFELVDWVAEVDLLSGEAGDQTPDEPPSEPEGTAGAADSANRPGAGRRTRF